MPFFVGRRLTPYPTCGPCHGEYGRPGKRSATRHAGSLQFGKYPARGVDGIVDIFLAVGDGHKAGLKR
ncbi:hypothetical protein FMK43_17565 [Klebsiella quasipneumoniae]|nr:hypothetical protein [Klebsiella quasipneumoniae]